MQCCDEGVILASLHIKPMEGHAIAERTSQAFLKNAIFQQNLKYPDELVTEQVNAKGEVNRMKREWSVQDANSLKQFLFLSL